MRKAKDDENGFKVIGRYVYPWLESAQTFATYEEALADLKQWKANATRDGREVIARIVPAPLPPKADDPAHLGNAGF
jgi:hypothetical protein